MSQVTVSAGGLNIVLNLPNGPLPTIDTLTNDTWSQIHRQPGTPDPQPGTYDNQFTNPQAPPVAFRNPA